MKFIVSILISIIFLFSISCKKEDEQKIRVYGQVKDPKGIGISNVRISLQGTILSGGIFSTNFSEIAYSTTDANGNFDINTKWQTVDKYRIKASKTSYFDLKIDLNSNVIQANTEYYRNITLYSIAWLKLIVNNSSGWNDDDVISYRYASNIQIGTDCWTNNWLVGNGQFYSAVHKYKANGDIYGVFEWNVQKMGATKFFKDSVFCIPCDTTVFVLNY